MFSISFDVEWDENWWEDMVARASDFSPVWPEASEAIRYEVDRNFDDQGTAQFGAWEQSKRALRDGGLTLVDTGNLRENALGTMVEEPDSLLLECPVAYGADVTTGKGQFPERPFAQVSEITALITAEQILQYLLEGKR